MEHIHACAGKEPYDSANLARKVLRRRKRRHDGVSLNAYRCTHCGKWHIGNAIRSAHVISSGAGAAFKRMRA